LPVTEINSNYLTDELFELRALILLKIVHRKISKKVLLSEVEALAKELKDNEVLNTLKRTYFFQHKFNLIFGR